MDKLKQIFGQQIFPMVASFSEFDVQQGYNCLKVKKNETDDLVIYVGVVNRHCENFQQQKLTEEQFKSSW